MPPIMAAKTPHSAHGSGSRYLHVALAAHEQSAAVKLGAGVLVDGQRLAGQNRFVGHYALAVGKTPVRRNAVAGLHACEIAGN